MTTQTMDAFVTAANRHMATPKGTADLLFALRKGCSVEGAIAACVMVSTRVENLMVALDVADEIIKQETAQRVGYMKIRAYP